MIRRTLPLILMLIVAIVVLAIVNLLIGSVDIPLKNVCRILLGDTSESEIWQNIIWKSRLPQALTAIMAGAGLAVSGLQMQTVFRNPLAGPSVLGISNGSALGVAFVVLLSGRIGGVALSRLGYLGDAAMSVAAVIGALAVLTLILIPHFAKNGDAVTYTLGHYPSPWGNEDGTRIHSASRLAEERFREFRRAENPSEDQDAAQRREAPACMDG